jgi:hypothetical protein
VSTHHRLLDEQLTPSLPGVKLKEAIIKTKLLFGRFADVVDGQELSLILPHMANLGAKLLLELVVGLGHVVGTARLAVM